MTPDYEEVLSFWLGELDANGRPDEARAKRWFTKDPAFDDELRARFSALHERAMAGELDAWRETPRGRLALILVLDQFSRNMFRGTPRMFASDEKALALTTEGLELGMDRRLADAEKQFFYMPLMHAEDLAAQDRCCALFAGWPSATYAEQHRDIIRKFGRFPHRNAILGRESTPEEIEFLKQPGSSF